GGGGAGRRASEGGGGAGHLEGAVEAGHLGAVRPAASVGRRRPLGQFVSSLANSFASSPRRAGGGRWGAVQLVKPSTPPSEPPPAPRGEDVQRAGKGRGEPGHLTGALEAAHVDPFRLAGRVGRRRPLSQKPRSRPT